jgi:hydrogenase maturation protease
MEGLTTVCGQPAPPRATILVIGYGNALRGDDGVGPRVAATVAGWGRPDLEALGVHQLTPELAVPLAAAELAIFVDARLAGAGEAVEIRPLEPAFPQQTFGHRGDPRSLLALAGAIYGRHPRAWSVTVPAANLALGEGLSPTAEDGLEVALRRISNLIDANGGRCTR